MSPPERAVEVTYRQAVRCSKNRHQMIFVLPCNFRRHLDSSGRSTGRGPRKRWRACFAGELIEF
jgi:hypothetical protein